MSPAAGTDYPGGAAGSPSADQVSRRSPRPPELAATMEGGLTLLFDGLDDSARQERYVCVEYSIEGSFGAGD